jgi:hypothetical protein
MNESSDLICPWCRNPIAIEYRWSCTGYVWRGRCVTEGCYAKPKIDHIASRELLVMEWVRWNRKN